jgi:Glyoxalase/Bleomycin resistance protein/Dioxygenase superfamily
MPIKGVHVLLYTPEPQALRATLRDALGWDDYVENPSSGEGWLIFALPPAELGVHPSDGSTKHQVTLMCDDLAATVEELRAKGVEVSGEPHEESFGVTTTLVLPGGVEVMLYEPRHASPLPDFHAG